MKTCWVTCWDSNLREDVVAYVAVRGRERKGKRSELYRALSDVELTTTTVDEQVNISLWVATVTSRRCRKVRNIRQQQTNDDDDVKEVDDQVNEVDDDNYDK